MCISRSILTAMMVFTLGLLIPQPASATNYYVSPTGNDANTGTSVTTAFLTIKKAAKVIQSGDTVYVAAGTYTDEIVVNGVQESSAPAVFRGSSGATVTASWRVVNSNYVQIKGFTFQDSTNRFLVWQGSYEGLIENSQFNAGDEGLLIKDGSLTIDDCQIQNFTHDGIQVDGEADVLVKDSTISGCQEAGMEIRKVAHVNFNNCTVSGQVGDGIEVNVVVDSIDPGPDPEGWFGDPVPLAGADGLISLKNGNYVYGDLYRRPEYPVDPSHVTGDLIDLDPAISFPPVDPGDAATNNNNANIPLTDNGNDPLDENGLFRVQNNDGIDLPPGVYYFSQLNNGGEIRVSGVTVVYVTGDVDMKSLTNPLGDPKFFQLFPMGAEVRIYSQTDVYAAIYAPSAKIILTGSANMRGMVIGNELDMTGQALIYPDASLQDLAESLIPALPTSPFAPPSWTPVTGGELDIRNSTLSDNKNAVSFETAQTFHAHSTQFSNNAAWGLRLQGDVQLTNCTVDDNATGGLWLKDVTDADLQIVNLGLSDNVQYGVYVDSSQLTFDSNNFQHWAISGSQYAISGVGSDLTFDDVTISGGTTAGVYLDQGNLTATDTTFSSSGYGLAADDCNVTLTSCTLSGNSVGLHANQNQSLTVNNTTITSNTLWGAVINGGPTVGAATFSACTVHGNVGGLKLVDGVDGNLLLRLGTVIRDNTATGLQFDNCNLAVNDQAGGANWSTLRNLYGISSNQSTLVLSNLTVLDSTSYGILCEDSTVSLSGCTVTGPYGAYADAANDSLTIDTSVFDAGSASGWGVVRFGGTLSVKNSTFDGYLLGVYLSSASGNDQATVLNTTIANSTAYGLYVHSGDAVVRNTILTGDGAGYGLVRLAGTTTHTHNVLHGFSTPFYGTSADATEVQKDPHFVDAANGDFHLGVGSSAINAGLDVGLLVPTDMDGNARPSFQAYEVGAYEYMSPNGSLRVLSWSEKR